MDTSTHAAHAARWLAFSPARKRQLMTAAHHVIVLKFHGSRLVLAGEAPRGFSERGRCSVALRVGAITIETAPPHRELARRH
jgi:hypothetical protein